LLLVHDLTSFLGHFIADSAEYNRKYTKSQVEMTCK
jgi:hypothetical protein